MSQLATILDREMLEVVRGVTIASPITPDAALPSRSGKDIFVELGGRYLLRDVLREQLGMFTKSGSDRLHHVTPTPYNPRDVISYLALPAPHRPRRFVMFLDPSLIPEVKGPRWVRLGQGIGYLLPNGSRKLPWSLAGT
jgi:hypothetical protein